MVFKFGLFLVGAIAVVLAQQPFKNANISQLNREKMLAALGSSMPKCIGESGVSPKELPSLNVPSYEKMCFLKCLALEIGTVDSDGNIVPHKMKENLVAFGFPEDENEDVLDAVTRCWNKIDKKIETCEDVMLLENCRPPLDE